MARTTRMKVRILRAWPVPRPISGGTRATSHYQQKDLFVSSVSSVVSVFPPVHNLSEKTTSGLPGSVNEISWLSQRDLLHPAHKVRGVACNLSISRHPSPATRPRPSPLTPHPYSTANFWMRPFIVSETYRKPRLSRARPCGRLNWPTSVPSPPTPQRYSPEFVNS